MNYRALFILVAGVCLSGVVHGSDHHQKQQELAAIARAAAPLLRELQQKELQDTSFLGRFGRWSGASWSTAHYRDAFAGGGLTALARALDKDIAQLTADDVEAQREILYDYLPTPASFLDDGFEDEDERERQDADRSLFSQMIEQALRGGLGVVDDGAGGGAALEGEGEARPLIESDHGAGGEAEEEEDDTGTPAGAGVGTGVAAAGGADDGGADDGGADDGDADDGDADDGDADDGEAEEEADTTGTVLGAGDGDGVDPALRVDALTGAGDGDVGEAEEEEEDDTGTPAGAGTGVAAADGAGVGTGVAAAGGADDGDADDGDAGEAEEEEEGDTTGTALGGAELPKNSITRGRVFGSLAAILGVGLSMHQLRQLYIMVTQLRQESKKQATRSALTEEQIKEQKRGLRKLRVRRNRAALLSALGALVAAGGVYGAVRS